MAKDAKTRHSFYVPHARVQRFFPNPTMAKQSFKAECDINTIMKKYEKTGLIEHLVRYRGQYADVASATDYQEALNTIMEASEMFHTLPSRVREKFNNNPQDFLAFTEDPANTAEMEELGLLKPREKSDPSTSDLKKAARAAAEASEEDTAE